MAFPEQLKAHLETAVTTTCRAWSITRRDGKEFGFTDHDMDLEFDGRKFAANTGLTARALAQSTGLSVDNSEAMGALTAASVSEEDILAGRFDGAEVQAWLLNWTEPDQRVLLFSGSVGEITRGNGVFQAELRGLTESLNQPQGQVYQSVCSAIVGDKKCRFDFGTPGYAVEVVVQEIKDHRVFRFADLNELDEFDHRWFERGRCEVLSGEAKGLVALVKNDRLSDDGREIELWDALQTDLTPGDLVRLEAGCDKRAATCRFKFDNFPNFRGFPHIPGEDWLMSVPKRSEPNTGGSLNIWDTVAGGGDGDGLN